MKRVAHVVNQFFAGIGGEEKADTAPGTLDAPAGPSRGLQKPLEGRAEVAPTIYFGDNHFHEQPEEARAALMREVAAAEADIVVLGPAFNAGRYGLACVEIGHMIAAELDCVCVTAMHPDNPAVDTYREYHHPKLFLFPTTETAAGMGKALEDLAGFVLRRLEGQPVGAAEDEGYLPRGIRFQERSRPDRRGSRPGHAAGQARGQALRHRDPHADLGPGGAGRRGQAGGQGQDRAGDHQRRGALGATRTASRPSATRSGASIRWRS